ncbi:MAG: hypothetical protein JO038_03330 [Alphaproteobacteria bacterium]|nr:hypothetical protein [Alphaproteobacteria bacterium]
MPDARPSAFRAGLLAAVLIGTPALALAQQPPPVAGRPAPKAVPEAPDQGGAGSSSGSLSEKLDRSGGVIHPPAGVDPGLTRPVPDQAGRMPVIPPPGAPGGNPQVNPK